MLNPFFLNNSKQEQGLIQSLVNEQLKMYGIEIYYIPRRYVKKASVIREVIQSEFDNAYPIEAYLDSYEGYGGQGTLLSKFGIQESDDMTLIVSRERYENYITPLIKNIPNIELSTRPKEGDLIYFPLGDRLFEINYVEHEQPFYQLQKNYIYTLKCQLYRYEDEVLDTGVETIDDEIEQIGYIQTLTLIGVAVPATASVSGICSGSVRTVDITDMGDGYTSAPIVAISAAPIGGVNAVGIASMDYGYIGCNGIKGTGKVVGVKLTNAGCGYVDTPIVTFTGGGGVGAAATIILEKVGGIKTLNLTNAGSGYISPPTVGISTPVHVGAAATATIGIPINPGAGSSVINTTISVGIATYLFPGGTTGGVFYKSAPDVTFSTPTGTGDNAVATATLDNYNNTGGTVLSLNITDEGRFYSSVPTVSISHPGTSFAAATIGIAGTILDPSTIAFSTTGRAYTSSPTVIVGTGVGTETPFQTAVGVATIHPITGVVTALSFNQSDPWVVGTSATTGIGYTVTPTISFSAPSPVVATATAVISAGGSVTSLSIGNSGFGYISTPTVSISGPSGLGTQFTATGIATIRFNSISTTGTLGAGSTIITGINTNGIIVGDRVRLGIGYSGLYNFIVGDSFVNSVGVSSLTINNTSTNVGIATSVFEFGIDRCGVVTAINIINGGGGYLTPPTITISNDSSFKNYIDEVVGVATAVGISTVSIAGTATVHIIDSGSQYVLTPTIILSSPISTSTGSFIFNEIVTGSSSGTTARVKKYDSVNNTLEVSLVDGSFTPGETIVGSESGASHTMRIQDKNDQVDPFADNDNIETRADDIIDFSKGNPFGMP
jgi:hypothetical protein